MVEHIPSYTANDSLTVGVLPRAPRGGRDFFDAHMRYPPLKVLTVDTITIPEEVPRRLVPGKRLDHLLRRSFCRRMVCHVVVDDTPTFGRVPLRCGQFRGLKIR